MWILGVYCVYIPLFVCEKRVDSVREAHLYNQAESICAIQQVPKGFYRCPVLYGFLSPSGPNSPNYDQTSYLKMTKKSFIRTELVTFI